MSELTQSIHPCLTVELRRVDDGHFEQASENKCDTEIPEVAVLIKFFNDRWERVGVDGFVAYHIAPHERLRKVFPIRGGTLAYRYIGVRAISNTATDALK